jgi:competence protein ComGC
MNMNKKNRIRGLVLLELLTVIFIISSLVLLLIPNFRWSMYKTQLAGCQSNLKMVSTALQLYANENEDYYPDDLTRLQPNYMKEIATCPSSGTNTYAAGYDLRSDKKSYTLHCKGKNHENMKLEEDQPYWSLIEGLKP